LRVLHRRRVDVEEENKENETKDRKRKVKRKIWGRGKISTSVMFLDIIHRRFSI
jgi:Na+/phosphate symporter